MTSPEITGFPGATASVVAGAMVVGGSWEDETAGAQETSAPVAPDPFAD